MFNSFSGNDACKLLADGAQLVDVRSSNEFSHVALTNDIYITHNKVTISFRLLPLARWSYKNKP
jgi:phage shock protein E